LRVAGHEVGNHWRRAPERGLHHRLEEGMQGALHRLDSPGNYLLDHIDDPFGACVQWVIYPGQACR
jgi:hypothetical protein